MTLAQIEQKAKNGDRRAQCALARRYDIGFNVQENRTKDLLWYNKSAEQGFALAQSRLASIYHQMYLEEELESMDEAIRWYREAANQGDVIAQRKLADEMSNEDPAHAAFWYQSASEAGDAVSQFKLAKLYEQGNGVPKNESEAFRWFSAAEQRGDDICLDACDNAAYEVGRCYALGLGVEKNADEALKRLLPIDNPKSPKDPWLMSRAQIWVWVVFADQEHSKNDLVEAYAWINLAATYAPTGEEFFGIMACESAHEFRDTLSVRLSKQQLTKAQLRSKELFVSRQAIYKRLGIG